jgi:Tyrosine phosphatase family
MELYSQILDNGVMAYSAIFTHIRDHPDEAFLFHCTGSLFTSLMAFVRY